MVSYLKYQEDQINDFLNSNLAKEMFDLLKKNNLYKIKIDSGPINERGTILYCISVSLMDSNDNFIYLFDDGYLTAYVELIRIKNGKEKFTKWNDIDFIDDINRIINYLKNHQY